MSTIKSVLEEIHARSWTDEEVEHLLSDTSIAIVEDPKAGAVDGGGFPGPVVFSPSAAKFDFNKCGEPSEHSCGISHPGCCC